MVLIRIDLDIELGGDNSDHHQEAATYFSDAPWMAAHFGSLVVIGDHKCALIGHLR